MSIGTWISWRKDGAMFLTSGFSALRLVRFFMPLFILCLLALATTFVAPSHGSSVSEQGLNPQSEARSRQTIATSPQTTTAKRAAPPRLTNRQRNLSEG